jgi:hypothetical protein
MSDTLRHFIRESLLVEIEQTTWMKGGIERAVSSSEEKGIISKAYNYSKNLFSKGLSFLGRMSLFSGNRKKSAWGKRAGIGSAVVGGIALFSWLKSGKKSNDDNAETEVQNSEDEMLNIESQLGELFSKNSSDLMNDIAFDSDTTNDASKTTTEKIKLFREHFEKILSNVSGITLQKSFTSANIGTASGEYDAVISKIRQFSPLKSQIDNIVGGDPAAKAWASRLIVARHAADIQFAIGDASMELASIAKDQDEMQQVSTVTDALVRQFSNIGAFKTAHEAISDE